MHGHVLVDEIPFCSAPGCPKKVSDLNFSVWIVRSGNLCAFCNEICFENTIRSYFRGKEEADRIRKEIGKRNLLEELGQYKG